MKRIYSIVLFGLLALHAWTATAENRLYIENFSIDPGATVDVAIMLDNEVTDFASFQADMYLPAGLELVQQYDEDNEEYFTFALTTRARSRMSIGSAVQADGAVRLMLTQTLPQSGQSMQTIKETSGALVTFKLKAAETASGTKNIRLENIVFTTASSTQYALGDSQTTLTITGSSGPDTPTGENNLYIEDFSIDAGATVDVSIMLDNEVTDFASFQADMYLPAGLELVQQYDEDNEEYFTFALTTRARSRMSIGSAVQGDGAVRLMLTQTLPQSGQSMQTIKETSGALVTFKLKAAATASGTKSIRLENIVFTTASSTQYTLENSQTSVSVTGSSGPDNPATENSLYIQNFNIDAGATVDVSIMLDNEVTDFASFQADMYLPVGLELVQQYDEDNEEYFTFALTTRARSRMSIGSAVQGDGAVRLMLTQTLPQSGQSMQTIQGTSGALVTFKLKAAATASGTKYIDLKNIVFTTASAIQNSFDDSRANVTISSSSPSSNLVVTTNSINLFTGTSQTLSVIPSTTNMTWVSSDTSIATVSADGVVTGIKPGNVTITCISNGMSSAPFSVNVLSIGDVNRDNQVTIADVTALVNIILGK